MSTFSNIKNIGVIISTVAALKKALADTAQQQKRALLHRKRAKKRKRNQRIAAGVLGGVVLGAIAAIFMAPDSTEDLKNRIAGSFSNGQHDYDEDAIIREASQKAEALAERAKKDSKNN